MRLSDFRILTFDCYGTLIDWESGILEALKPLTSRLRTAPSRDKILEAHARHEAAQELATPHRRYRHVLATVYRRLGEEWGVPTTWDECMTYGDSVRNWPAFPDSAAALAYLKKHYKLAILSNVDNESFAHSNKRLGVEFDAVFTAEDVGCYKPEDRNFTYMLERLEGYGIAKTDILHTAESLFHDHAPANRMGLSSCWIFRRHDKPGFGATLNPGVQPRYNFRFNSMAEMADAHRKEVGA